MKDQAKKTVLVAENLSKDYFYNSAFSESVLSNHSVDAKISALKNVSFELYQGDVLGIVGSNGSGKSTLLKVISGITRPSSGTITTYGRIASILEIGTGFHPDLSGRDNVFLSGSVLGMSEKHINEIYEDIVTFSELQAFMDLPVKKYSNGMYLRLAFSIVVHVDADLILLDEVFTVGDQSFKRKCEAAIKSLAKSEKTILLVSHELSNLSKLCNKYMILSNGQIAELASSRSVLDNYFLSGFNASLSSTQPDNVQNNDEDKSPESTSEDEMVSSPRHAYEFDSEPSQSKIPLASIAWTRSDEPKEKIELLELCCQDENGNTKGRFDDYESVTIKCRFIKATTELVYPSFMISYSGDIPAMVCNPQNGAKQEVEEMSGTLNEQGEFFVECTIPGRLLNHGMFFVSIFFLDTHLTEVLGEEFLIYFVVNRNQEDRTLKGDDGTFNGPFNPRLNWLSKHKGDGKN